MALSTFTPHEIVIIPTLARAAVLGEVLPQVCLWHSFHFFYYFRYCFNKMSGESNPRPIATINSMSYS